MFKETYGTNTSRVIHRSDLGDEAQEHEQINVSYSAPVPHMQIIAQTAH
jgi:hypothetical protein